MLEDILNPIPVDITLSGKYPDTPVNIGELASVEVLLEFKRPRKQLVGTKDAIKQYNLPVTLHDLAAVYAKS